MDLETTCKAQMSYATWTDALGRLALLFLSIAFGLYVFGVSESFIPLSELSKHWGLQVNEYIALTKAPTGWQWVGFLGKGDYQSLVGIVLLALTSVLALLRATVIFLNAGQYQRAGLAIAQSLVLITATSGFIGGTH